MPRVDAFRKAAGETIPSRPPQPPVSENPEAEKPEEDSKSKLDFSLYLREAQ